MSAPAAVVRAAPAPDLARARALIEVQLPVSKLSKECYKERKANAGQTLTALGSYWKGRKPLILVRAVVLGLLLPATDDPKRDRAIFLKLMLMDEAGLLKRKKRFTKAHVARVVQLLPDRSFLALARPQAIRLEPLALVQHLDKAAYFAVLLPIEERMLHPHDVAVLDHHAVLQRRHVDPLRELLDGLLNQLRIRGINPLEPIVLP